ncbi:MAG: metal-dependent transcriptional regulator [Candidatus Coproplasma sp.]
MKHNQSVEDYLETVLMLSKELEDVHQIEIARKMGVSQPAVQKALRALKDKGYIVTDGLHIHLTEQGREYAERVYHRHIIIREFLVANGVDSEIADADACEIEHVISQQSFEAIEKLVKLK